MRYFKLINKKEVQPYLNTYIPNFKLLNPSGLKLKKRVEKEHFMLLNEKAFRKCQCRKCREKAV